LNALNQYCNQALELIDSALIKNAESSESQAFFQKLQGNLCRYTSEYLDGQENAQKASARYKAALTIATEYLAPPNSVRVETILNSPVLKCKHQHN
jgi:14-3-3 protein epsilon